MNPETESKAGGDDPRFDAESSAHDAHFTPEVLALLTEGPLIARQVGSEWRLMAPNVAARGEPDGAQPFRVEPRVLPLAFSYGVCVSGGAAAAVTALQ